MNQIKRNTGAASNPTDTAKSAVLPTQDPRPSDQATVPKRGDDSKSAVLPTQDPRSDDSAKSAGHGDDRESAELPMPHHHASDSDKRLKHGVDVNPGHPTDSGKGRHAAASTESNAMQSNSTESRDVSVSKDRAGKPRKDGSKR